MPFLIKDEKLLENYNEISENNNEYYINNNIKTEFASKPALNEKHIKTKVKCYNGKSKPNFHNNKIPKEGSQCISLSVILIDSIYRKDKS